MERFGGCPDYIKWRYAQKPSPIVNFKGNRVKFPFEAEKMGFSHDDLKNFFKFHEDISSMSYEESFKYDNISIRDFVSKYVDNEIAKSVVGYFSAIYFVTRDDETPVGEYARCQNEISVKKALGYPLGGTGSIPEAYCRIIQERGGKVITGNGVQSIAVENGKAKGVILKNGEQIKADIIISNAAIKETINGLVGSQYYPENFVINLNSYKYSFSTSAIKMALSEKIFDDKPTEFINECRQWFNKTLR